MTPGDNASAEASSLSNLQHKTLISYILAHAAEDQRPYLEVTILGHSMLGLLDSGSSLSIVGSVGWDILARLGLRLDRSKATRCIVANGQSCSSIGVVTAPLCLMGRVRVLNLVVVPEISSQLILGMDFWMAMDVVPDLKRDVCNAAHH